MADQITVYVRKDCHLCSAALQVVGPVAQRWNIPVEIKDIDDPATDTLLRALYDHAVPVVHLNGREVARHRIEPPQLEQAIEESRN